MSKRLSKVVVEGTRKDRNSSFVVTKITNLGYWEDDVAKSL